MTPAALLSRVGALTGPDRETDAEIVAAFRYVRDAFPDWAVNWGGPYVANPTLDGKRSIGRVALGHSNGKTGLHWSAEQLTASIDAAVALVERLLPDGYPDICKQTGGEFEGMWLAQISCYARKLPFNENILPTPALALLAALLQSLAVDAETEG